MFLAVFIQAMIPVGFMPNMAGASVGTPLVICSGFDQKTIFVDQQGNPVKETPSPASEHSKPCLFSVVTSSHDDLVHGVVLPDFIYGAANSALQPEIVLYSTITQRPPAIGPPRLI